jgi:hypothetical protein
MSHLPVVNYVTLTAALVDIANRSGDSDYEGSTDSFINAFEKSANRKILSRFGEMTSTLTTDANGLVTLPTDFIAARNKNIINGTLLTSLMTIPKGAVAQVFQITTGGDPYYMSISGSQISVNPPSIRSVTFDYYAKFVGLSGSNATNWLVTQHPDYYVAGCMREASIYLDDDRGIVKWSGLKQEREDEILALFAIEQTFDGAGLIMSGATP